MKKIFPCLWFPGNGEEAAKFYTSVFKNSKITTTTHYTEGTHMPEGTALTIMLDIGGQELMILNAGKLDEFNHSISLTVPCDTQQEIDELWEKLSKGGSIEQCGWLRDKYGVAWQIAPAKISEWLSGTKAQSAAVLQAIMSMVKLDIVAMEKAFEGAK